LWTILPLDGKFLIPPRVIAFHHGLWEKFMWYRVAKGALSIEGHKVGEPATSVKPEIPCCYGETGFQASGIIFPSEGCYEITGRVADARLTFIVEVHVKN
jgi:hypothetical protein